MGHRILSLFAVILLALSAVGCASIGGQNMEPTELPGIGAGFTEVGNPEEEEAQIKGVYVNEEFDVRITYPVRWEIDERGTEEAEFFSSGESVTASFVWLGEGESFEDFLIDARGGEEGLKTYLDTAFDISKCRIEESGDSISIECYHYKGSAVGNFVLVINGYVKSDTGSEAVTASTTADDDKYKAQEKVKYEIKPLEKEDSEDSSPEKVAKQHKKKLKNLARQYVRKPIAGQPIEQAGPSFGFNSFVKDNAPAMIPED